jgi:hypothetical protein
LLLKSRCAAFQSFKQAITLSNGLAEMPPAIVSTPGRVERQEPERQKQKLETHRRQSEPGDRIRFDWKGWLSIHPELSNPIVHNVEP